MNVCFVLVKNTATIIQIFKVYLSLYICFLIFLIFLSFWMVFAPMSCFRLLFLWKAIGSSEIGSIGSIGSSKKVFSKALLVFQMDQWFWIICFILVSVWLYVTVSGNTWAFCVAFGVRKYFLSKSWIFLILVSIKDE